VNGPAGRGEQDRSVTAPRQPRLRFVYGILVALLFIAGVLLAAGEAVWGLLVLAIATLLNLRLMLFRRRLDRGSETRDP
jgi:O-antigen ligase